jgi:tRNA pseudouridine65 synthase/23S rRNA pseudouridine1911/1915/1917 synthase
MSGLNIKTVVQVPDLEHPVRIADYLVGKLPELPTRASVKKALQRELVLLNGKTIESGRYLRPLDVIQLLENPRSSFPVLERQVPVLYEDEFLAVVEKPAGFYTSGNHPLTLDRALPYNLSKSNQDDALSAPYPVHRLDQPTSGILLVAKTQQVLIDISQQFAKGSIRKIYTALVHGLTEKGFINNETIGDKKAQTRFVKIHHLPSLKNDYLSLVDCYPTTGRKHQIRIHLKALGHPIVGDQTYTSNTFRQKGLFLFARGITFRHPVTQNHISLYRSLPRKFASMMTREQRRWEKYH